MQPQKYLAQVDTQFTPKCALVGTVLKYLEYLRNCVFWELQITKPLPAKIIFLFPEKVEKKKTQGDYRCELKSTQYGGLANKTSNKFQK